LGDTGAALSTRRAGSKLSVWMAIANYRHKQSRWRGRWLATLDCMISARASFRCVIWIALVAVLVAVLAPTLAHPVGWAPVLLSSFEVCTSEGAQPSPAKPAGRDGDGQSTAKHCTECCLPCVQCVPAHGPPVAGAVPLSHLDDPRRTCQDGRFPSALHARFDSQPRAPPRANRA
jgi:hypothetical protein